jgi:hypothetical protein
MGAVINKKKKHFHSRCFIATLTAAQLRNWFFDDHLYPFPVLSEEKYDFYIAFGYTVQ